MKVLHINYSDRQGGASIAAYRHHEALIRAGIESKMLVFDKKTNNPNVILSTCSQKRLKFLHYRIISKILRKYYSFYAAWTSGMHGFDLSTEASVKEADIIVIHWTGFNFLSNKGMENILKLGKPVFWFLHDMWALTGGCHYSLDCDNFTSHCHSCPMFHNKKGSHRYKDLAYKQFREKLKRLTQYSNLHFVTPSEWLADKVRISALFNRHKITVARNVLDMDVFKIKDKIEVRKNLNLPEDKKLILFGADNISSPYKGWHYLKEALKDSIKDVMCVIYGHCLDETELGKIGMPYRYMGSISEVDKLVSLYNACDLLITPSLADNYPNVIIEAMACGLPVISFATGGIVEIIKDGENGILVKDRDSFSLRKAIITALDNLNYLSSNTRMTVLKANSYNNNLLFLFQQ